MVPSPQRSPRRRYAPQTMSCKLDTDRRATRGHARSQSVPLMGPRTQYLSGAGASDLRSRAGFPASSNHARSTRAGRACHRVALCDDRSAQGRQQARPGCIRLRAALNVCQRARDQTRTESGPRSGPELTLSAASDAVFGARQAQQRHPIRSVPQLILHWQASERPRTPADAIYANGSVGVGPRSAMMNIVLLGRGWRKCCGRCGDGHGLCDGSLAGAAVLPRRAWQARSRIASVLWWLEATDELARVESQRGG
jgi:hypothetical protein